MSEKKTAAKQTAEKDKVPPANKQADTPEAPKEKQRIRTAHRAHGLTVDGDLVTPESPKRKNTIYPDREA